MSTIVEQVREGLEAKVEGIQNALLYVKDAREVEHLQKDLQGAVAALKKLDEPDTRTEEEKEKLAAMIQSETAVESTPWSSMSPIEKFQYHVKAYCDKLEETAPQVTSSRMNMVQVVKHMQKTKGDSAFFMNPIIAQFENSLAEISYSEQSIENQLALKDDALALAADQDFFDKLELLNRFLNNPMNLPHLSEEREAQIKELRDVKK